MFFDSWMDLMRVGVVGTLAYGSLVLLLRLSGKRTLSKLHAFDLVVTVALGSTLATALLTKDVSLAEGVAATALLILLQFAVAITAKRSARVQAMVSGTPRILLSHGTFCQGAMGRERVTEGEIRAAVRQAGYGDLSRIAAVVLETDGSLSVVSIDKAGDGSALCDAGGLASQSL